MSKPGIRWFHLSPDRFVLLLLVVEACLLPAEWFDWLPKGYALLTALASILAVTLLMFLWFAIALLFRRRFQFGIRTLLVFTLVCSIACSWLTVRMKQARKQKEAVAAIWKQAERVRYDYPLNASGGPIRPVPTWLRTLFGDDMFDTVIEVVTYRDAALEHIGQLPGLQSLDFYCGADVTDKGLAHLRDVPRLRKLRFGPTYEITDAGLANLRFLKHLQRLEMEFVPMTDARMQYLQGLTELEELSLGPEVTDTGLSYLAGLSKLSSLSLGSNRITGSGLKQLKGLSQLRKHLPCWTCPKVLCARGSLPVTSGSFKRRCRS